MDVFISKRRMQPAVALALFLLIVFIFLAEINSVCSSMDTHEEVNELNYIEMNNIASRKLLRTMSKPPSPQSNGFHIWQMPPAPPPQDGLQMPPGPPQDDLQMPPAPPPQDDLQMPPGPPQDDLQ
ncbi:hypothetical protein MKW92_021650 [Papaver armeniacum]|nr:hypothetical protein MKW92_021650 [Papaver armeniacum]